MEVRSLTEGFNSVDPLIDDFSVCLIPRAVISKPHLPNPNPNSSIFDTLLQARVSSSPDNLLKTGKTILEGGINHLEANKTKFINTENENGRKQRRPGLGIQQAKFTMRPIPSQPVESLEPSFDLSKSDPDEFFADFERKERVRKEMRRVNGQPLYDFDPNQPVVRRPRRPSLLGTTATYKHRSYPGFSSTNETFENDVPSPTHNNVLRDSSIMHDSSGVKASDSKSVTSEATVLADLLPLVEELDENGVQDLLQEKLNIKDVDIGNFVLPEWRVPLPDSVFNLSGASKTVRNKNQMSPRRIKSPLASISVLNRHIAKRTPSKDPFSPLHLDSSPSEAIDPSRISERRVGLTGQSNEVDARGELRSPTPGVVNVEISGNDDFVSVVNDVGPTINEPVEKEGPLNEEENIIPLGKNTVKSASKAGGQTSEPEIQEDEVVESQLPVRQLNFEEHDMENPSSCGVGGEMHEPVIMDDISVKVPAKKSTRSSKRRIEEKGESEEPSEQIVSDETVKEGGETITSESDARVSKETQTKKRKVNGGQQDRKKENIQKRRFSLYNAGTKWEAGVRRSSRIRMRPLQFWKGERFLYGRVNQSLVTVIGVKYASPEKDVEEPKVKIKSFVSGKDEDLLKFYSLY